MNEVSDTESRDIIEVQEKITERVTKYKKKGKKRQVKESEMKEVGAQLGEEVS